MKRTGFKPRSKPLPRVSKKRKKHRQSREGKAAKSHMNNVAQLGCIVCGAKPVDVHHEGRPRSDFRVLPLCPPHHRQEYGPGAYHYDKPAFYAKNGDSASLLKRVDDMLR